jgi:hypothetical protein
LRREGSRHDRTRVGGTARSGQRDCGVSGGLTIQQVGAPEIAARMLQRAAVTMIRNLARLATIWLARRAGYQCPQPPLTSLTALPLPWRRLAAFPPRAGPTGNPAQPHAP